MPTGTFAEVVHRGDVGVLQARAVSGLGAEPLEEALVVSGVGTQHLDGDMAHQRLVGGSPDLAHSASRDDLLKAVALGYQESGFIVVIGRSLPP